jgi:hypothetical protein
MCVAMRVFRDEVGNYEDFNRPREGDVVFFPLNGKLFQITYVRSEAVFYQLGSLQFYEVQMELFQYADEHFSTGVTEIDERYNVHSKDMSDHALLTATGLRLLTNHGEAIVPNDFSIDDIDPTAQNEEFQTDADEILNWNERDPFSVGGKL